ncbi:ELWxxDGT repeat protein [Winogradskyella flava]|uniref:ELWxxDGT repeat protein n=1 Tax=Winogradskyella flava TaxID=1884876 RepID=UPI00249382E1|nr:ELWxxDGT repeat protein [Winogradskyella flava]
MKKTLLPLHLLIISLFSFSQVSLVKDLSPTGDGVSGELIAINNSILFSGNNQVQSASDFELFISDGTDVGTQLIQNIGPGSVSGDPKDFFHRVNQFTGVEEVFFAVNNQSSGNNFDLWVTNGTSAGTSLVFDHNTSGSSNPKIYVEYESNGINLLFMQAQGTNAGSELYASIGASSGNILVEDINPGSDGSFPDNFVVYNDNLYFAATSANGRELWKSTGTLNSTSLVKNIGTGNADGNPEYLIVYNNKIYFSADNGTNGSELWQSDGTTAGTQMVTDIFPGTTGSHPENFIVYNNNLYFTATSSIFGTELFYIDTNDVVSLANDISNGSASSNPSNLFIYNNSLYFSADDGINGDEIWSTNGTIATTQILKNINTTGSSFPQNFTEYNGNLYFTADNGSNGIEIWTTDGTNAGTQIVADIAASAISSSPESLVVSGNTLFFHANDGINGRELWKYIDPALSIPNLEETKSIKLYPNPVENTFSIDYNSSIDIIEIYDSTGKKVKMFKQEESSYDISDLAAGIYFARLYGKTGSNTLKITKN